MPKTVYEVTVDIKTGKDQKKPDYENYAKAFKDSDSYYAFWTSKVYSVPLGSDVRKFMLEKPDGSRSLNRPNSLVSPEAASFTLEDPNEKGALIFDEEDKVAVLKIVQAEPAVQFKEVSEKRVVDYEFLEGNDVQRPVPVPLYTEEPDGVKVLLETNSFMLQGINESFQEKFEVVETFGDPVVFFFGDRQRIFQYSGTLFDSKNWAWKEKFIHQYNNNLRGTKAVQNGAIAILMTNTAIVRGYILSASIGQTDQTEGYAAFSFNMFAVDRIPIDPIELSPQEKEKEEEEQDQQTVFLRVNDETFRPGETVEEIELAGGVIQPATAPYFFDQNYSAIVHDAMKPVAAVGGVSDVVRFPQIPADTSVPAEIQLDSTYPDKYNNLPIQCHMGTVYNANRSDLTLPGVDTLSSFEAVTAGYVPKTSLLWHYINPGRGAPGYSQSQIAKLKTLVEQKKLIGVFESSTRLGTYFETPISEIRTWSTDPTRFNSQVNGHPYGQASTTQAFELVPEKPLVATDFGYTEDFPSSPRFRVTWREKDSFVPYNPGFKPVFYFLERNKAIRVVSEHGVTSQIGDKHILTDADGGFITKVKDQLDAGRKAYILLPDAVVDESATKKTPSAKIEIKKVLSDSQIEFGVLSKPTQGPITPRSPVGRISLDNYKIVIESDEAVTINEEEIRKAVLNPPYGAFDNVDLDTAEMVQPTGAVILMEGRHYVVSG